MLFQPGVRCSIKVLRRRPQKQADESWAEFLKVRQDRKLCLLPCRGLFYAKLVRWMVQLHQSASIARQVGVSDYGVLLVPLGFMVQEEFVLIWFACSSLSSFLV